MTTQLFVRGLFDAATAGFVPPSGGGTTTFLRADGAWAAAGGGGGGGAVSDGDYGDVTVSGSGAVWTVDALPESRITGLVSDLAAKVPGTRTITATAPLTIGGGASADLSANRTIAVGSFSTGASGVVTASGGATRILLGDNTWITIAQLIALLGIRLGEFGDASDGSATMDGSTAVTGWTLSGSTYTANRECFFDDLTINSGVIARPNGYPQCVRGTLNNNGTWHFDGGNASGVTAGSPDYAGAVRPLPPGIAGVNGSTVGAGSVGTPSSNCPRGFSTAAAPGGTAPALGASGPANSGTAGGVGHGGGGGAGGNNLGLGIGSAGGDAGAVTLVTPSTAGDVRTPATALLGRPVNSLTPYSLGSSGGSGAAGNPSGDGGGSGASGAWGVLRAFQITGSGAFRGKGGNGGDGTLGGGGGGGGPGGVFVLMTTGTPPTIDVTGGSGGAGGPGSAPNGQPGGNGGDGGDGLTIVLT